MYDNSDYSQGKCNGQVTTSTYNSIKYEKETYIVTMYFFFLKSLLFSF